MTRRIEADQRPHARQAFRRRAIASPKIYVKNLSLPHALYPLEAERFQRALDGLALGIKNGTFQRDINARLHGGHIDAGNHPGGGALFTVSLPVSRHSPTGATEPQLEPARL